MKHWTLLLLAMALSAPAAFGQLIPRGSSWKYLDDGSNQGTAWRELGFDDSAWASGDAQLGYGDGDEATVVSFGPNANNKFITTYFRHSFQVANPASVTTLSMRILRDDGAVVYLNGVEVNRTNLPQGAIGFQTEANAAVGDASESAYRAFALDPADLVAGANVVAVEVHQTSPTSSDISFDFELDDRLSGNVSRGPYLQQKTESSILVRWRTLEPSDSLVVYGRAVNNKVRGASDDEVTTDHEVLLEGLDPETLYFYSVGAQSQLLMTSIDLQFKTAPILGSHAPTRVWVLGDCGTANPNARAVRDAYLDFTGSPAPDVWLMLGDNAYGSGTDVQYQGGVFDTYPYSLRQTALWSTRGNHETSLNVYTDVFSFPMNAEAGGFPSGSESYYSFDYANVHFVCLDSQGSSRAAGSAMMLWLEEDLAATTQDWIVAFWHHPPYTKGSHDSDNNGDSGGRMRDMREVALPILEDGGVDLVLTGHSHSYERSILIDGHYEDSATFDPSMILDDGDGRPSGDGPYVKNTGARSGAVYTVAGSSGRTGGGPLNHPVMISAHNALGSLVIDVDGLSMLVRFLDVDGIVRDTFEMQTGPAEFDLLTSPFVAGLPARLQVTGATPGEPVYFAYSHTGAGPTNTAFGPVALSPPIGVFGPVVADDRGVAAQFVPLPVNASGLTLWLQAVQVFGPGDGQLTPPSTTSVQ